MTANTRVDFCHLAEAEQFHSYLCRSAMRLIDNGERVLLRSDSANEIEEISRQLWIFPGGFISHEYGDNEAVPADNGQDMAQLLLAQGTSHYPCSALINLSVDFPNDHQNFRHIVEVIRPEDDLVNKARQRYRHYKDNGYDPQYHKIGSHA